MTGLFAQYQPHYARHGVTTFPCDTTTKKPLVRNYLNIGRNAATALARKFTEANAIGFATGRRNGITVLDIDVADERVLDEAVARHGEPRIVVRTASGKFHTWYRFNGERRQIRPWPGREIDLLGEGGFVLAPPSAFGAGQYKLIQGALDDLSRLTTMTGLDCLQASIQSGRRGLTKHGHRNTELWRHCMQQAHHCDDLDTLVDVARTYNGLQMEQPLDDIEVIKVAASAWGYTARSQNLIGRGGGVVIPHTDIDGLMQECPDAFILESFLRRHHWGRDFIITNALAAKMPEGGWTRKRLAKARGELQRRNRIRVVRPGGYKRAARYRWPRGVVKNDHQ
jgi:Bifunctional DNA primase/polymerase, N-terminal